MTGMDAKMLTQANRPQHGWQPAHRLSSIDIVRGAIMILMALDHVRDYVSNARFQPEDLTRASAALFATRWITHFCAPTFFLLAGVGIGISHLRGANPGELSRYLLIRGFWLLVLELVITPLGWRLDVSLLPAFAVVLWALGWSMILMAALIHVPPKVVLVLALLTIIGHNLLDGIQPPDWGSFAWAWQVLHVPGFVIPGKLLIAYPLIPWVAVMALGFVLADAYMWESERRQRFLIVAGIATIVAFVWLRTVNGYGNPFPWSSQRTFALSVASFLNVTKYPPSLDFLLMTLGPVFIALALTERVQGRIAGLLTVYGRVPLFFYVVHIFLAHLAGVTIALIQHGELRRIPAMTDPNSIPAWYGVPLWGVYLAWAAVVLLMYFPCRLFAEYKSTRNYRWLRYL
jgi:uncharacterized membrane protein